MCKKIIYLTVFFVVGLSFSAMAQQFTYKPINPAFGGDTFNYNWLITSANAQNGFREPGSAGDDQSELELFGEQLNRQILSQISRTLLQQQIEGLGDLTQEGTFSFGNLEVEVFQTDEGLVINIFDTSNGEQTQVIVPN